MLLGNDQRPLGIPQWSTLVDIARNLNPAAQEFAEGRRQIRLHALEAAARGQELVTLRLRLPSDAAGAATRYSDAVRPAEELGAMGQLLVTAEQISQHANIRRHDLKAITEQLAAHNDRNQA